MKMISDVTIITAPMKIIIAVLVMAGVLMFTGGVISSQKAAAQISIAPGTCTNCPGGPPQCVTFGFTGISVNAIFQGFKRAVENALTSFTNWISAAIDAFTGAILDAFNFIFEGQFMQWIDNFMHYDLIPSLQSQMNQIYTSYIDSARMNNSVIDGVLHATTIATLQEIESDSYRRYRPSTEVCRAGSITGSNFARSNNLMRAFRKASERMFTQRGNANTQMTMASLGIHDVMTAVKADDSLHGAPVGRFAPGIEALSRAAMAQSVQHASIDIPSYGQGPVAHAAYQYERYCQFLANVADNAGHSGCRVATLAAVPAATRGMDANPTHHLFNRFVIDVTDPATAKGLEALKENLTGLRPPELIPERMMNSTQGHNAMVDQRVFLARQNAARSPIEFIASTRLPAAQARELVRELRESVGVPLSGIDPEKTSYKEIMNAMSNEKFISGRYNLDQVDTIDNVERESLILSIFYLMQLRDYYELMERGVLALAVQTALEVDVQVSSDPGSAGGGAAVSQ